MDLLHIMNAGVYRKPQIGRQVCPQKWISFYISGRIRSQSYYPDGTLLVVYENAGEPVLELGMPGFISNFEFGAGRENYVVMYQSDAVFYQEETHQISLKYNDLLLPLSPNVRVRPDEVNTLRMTFQTIMDYCRSAIPANLASADLLLSSLLLRFLQASHPGDDPVEQFRKKIDADAKWEIPLEEHCRQLGFSRDYLRRAFIQRYKIAPGEYRIRKRLQQIIHAFAYTNMNMKEIAFSVGMKNVTHLNLLIRKYYDKSPTELCREYRKNGSV